MTLSPREDFLIDLFSHPPLAGDAIVVLCGEDAIPRAEKALWIFRELQGSAPIVLSGGKADGEHLTSAEQLKNWYVGKGVARDRLIVENDSQNTREQAMEVLDLAEEKGWKRLLLVASSYHLPRAFLSFVAQLGSSGIRLVPIPANQSDWDQSPAGIQMTRRQLRGQEMVKIDLYHAMGHCASWQSGLAHLSVKP